MCVCVCVRARGSLIKNILRFLLAFSFCYRLRRTARTRVRDIRIDREINEVKTKRDLRETQLARLFIWAFCDKVWFTCSILNWKDTSKMAMLFLRSDKSGPFGRVLDTHTHTHFYKRLDGFLGNCVCCVQMQIKRLLLNSVAIVIPRFF